MTYYHGTSSNYLPGILKDGLVYKPDNRWDVEVDLGYRMVRPGRERFRDGYIYVTTDPQSANWYASNRALYVSAKPNKWFDFYSHRSMDEMVLAKKFDTGLYVPNTHPCVFEVDVDSNRLEEDQQCADGFRYFGAISPNHLRLIWEGKAQQLPKAA